MTRSDIDLTRDVRSFPVCDAAGMTRGWVRLDADRVGHANQTQFCITVDTTGAYLSPFEALAFAAKLKVVAAEAEALIAKGDACG